MLVISRALVKAGQILPRSWSLWGRCSGRSGGAFLTSDFFSAVRVQRFFCLSLFLLFSPLYYFFIVSDHKNKQEDESCYLWCVLPTVHLEEAVSLVSGNAYRCRSITKPHLQISNITITWKVLRVMTKSPLSQLLAA